MFMEIEDVKAESEVDLVAEARELLAKATPGPWTAKSIEGQPEFEISDAKYEWQICCVAGYAGARRFDGNYESETNAELIARIPDLLSSLCNELEQQRSDADRLRAALEAIVNIAGNLSDERVENVNGINDARSRALMVVTARQIAQNALAKGEEK